MNLLSQGKDAASVDITLEDVDGRQDKQVDQVIKRRRESLKAHKKYEKRWYVLAA